MRIVISDSDSPIHTTIGSIDWPCTLIPSSSHFFTPRLKHSISANPSHHILLFLLQDWLQGFPELFTEVLRIYGFLKTFPYLTVLVVGSVRQIKLIHVSFRADVKISSRAAVSAFWAAYLSPQPTQFCYLLFYCIVSLLINKIFIHSKYSFVISSIVSHCDRG